MKSILVGIDGSTRGQRALAWAARQADREGARLTLVCVVDPGFARAAGMDDEEVDAAVEATLGALVGTVAATYPQLETATDVIIGKVVESLVDAAEGHDMIVLGSHHGATVGEVIGAAKGLRVSVSAGIPTVLVPADWDPDVSSSGVVVGVASDDSAEAAVSFAVREALASDQPLTLISAWGLPSFLSRPAEAMGGGLAPVGEQFQRNLAERVRVLKDENPGLDVSAEAPEGASPAQVLLQRSAGSSLLVLGTHSRSALGRALFGSVSHGVLLGLNVPTVVVPCK